MDEQKSVACSTDGSDGKCIQIFNSKTLKIYLMRHRHKDKKNNFVLVHSKKAYMGSRGTPPLVFKVGPS